MPSHFKQRKQQAALGPVLAGTVTAIALLAWQPTWLLTLPLHLVGTNDTEVDQQVERSRLESSATSDAKAGSASLDHFQSAGSAAAGGVDPLPGGGLPIESAQLPGHLENPPPIAAARKSGREHENQVENLPRPTSDVVERQSVEHPRPILRQPAVVRTSAVSPSDRPQRLEESSQLVRSMHELHDPDPQVSDRAALRLREAGFSAAHIELARGLTCDDPLVRRELASRLAGTPGIDARVWLTWLSRDPDADVRLAAMSVMATTGDERLLRRIAEMARGDDDPRIQEQGRRLARARQAER